MDDGTNSDVDVVAPVAGETDPPESGAEPRIVPIEDTISFPRPDHNEPPAEAATAPDIDTMNDIGTLRDVAKSMQAARDGLLVERDSAVESLQRTQAEFQNFRKRMIREKTEVVDRATVRLVEAMLPALESLELAVTSADESPGVLHGLKAVQVQLNQILEKEGLRKIEPSSGEDVDPAVHEPVVRSSEGGSEGAEEGRGPKVTKVLRPGYELKGRLLRPAMVEFTD